MSAGLEGDSGVADLTRNLFPKGWTKTVLLGKVQQNRTFGSTFFEKVEKRLCVMLVKPFSKKLCICH